MNLQQNRNVSFLLIVFSSLCFFTSVSGQSLDTSITNNYSPSVIEKTFKVHEKLTLTKQRQKVFANHFKTQETILSNLIKNRNSKADIDKARNKADSLFENLLSSKEKFDYFNVINEKKSSAIPNSQFTIAIQFKNDIQITSDTVINAILDKIQQLRKNKDEFLAQNPGKYYDSKAFESLHLTNLLTEQQYTKLLIIKNTDRSKQYALKDWNELELRGFTAGKNKDSCVADLSKFYLARQNIYDRYAHNSIKKGEMLGILNENQPPIYKAIMHARRNPDNDTQGSNFSW